MGGQNPIYCKFLIGWNPPLLDLGSREIVLSAVCLPHGNVSLFSHMQKAGFLKTPIICCQTIIETCKICIFLGSIGVELEHTV